MTDDDAFADEDDHEDLVAARLYDPAAPNAAA